MQSSRGLVSLFAFGGKVVSVTAAILALAAWRRTIKAANVLQTDPSKVLDSLSLCLLGSFLLLAGVPMLLLWRVPLAGQGVLRQAGFNLIGFIALIALAALLLLAFFADLSGTMRNHRSIRYLINPVNSIHALGDLVHQLLTKPSGPPVEIGLDAHILPRPPGAKPPLLVLQIGETGRADHFSLNGYDRPTSTELTALGVMSFRQVTSCGTNTTASLPCMFSALGKSAFESRQRDSENLLDLVQRAGMAVLWVDNQAGCKGLCERVPHADADAPVTGSGPLPAGLCQGGECLDEALLHGLDLRRAALPAAARERCVLLVLHQMGSHGPAYYKRSPADRKPFEPECATNVLVQCGYQALINAYDNSVAYTDHVLAQTIGWLQRQQADSDTSMLYVADHGESLGENNLYLHGLPYGLAPVEQKHVPWIMWLSASTQANLGLQPGCLAGRLNDRLTHDNLFDTVLGVLGVRAAEYKLALDVTASCRVP